MHPALPCPALPCPALPCHAMPCHAMPCLAHDWILPRLAPLPDWLVPHCLPGAVCRYYNDVWSFDLEDLRWTPLGPKPGQTAPAPRGGCQLALSGDQLFIFGGYSVKKAEQDTGGWVGGQGGQGAQGLCLASPWAALPEGAGPSKPVKLLLLQHTCFALLQTASCPRRSIGVTTMTTAARGLCMTTCGAWTCRPWHLSGSRSRVSGRDEGGVDDWGRQHTAGGRVTTGRGGSSAHRTV